MLILELSFFHFQNYAAIQSLGITVYHTVFLLDISIAHHGQKLFYALPRSCSLLFFYKLKRNRKGIKNREMISGEQEDSALYGTTQLSIHLSHGLEIILHLLSRIGFCFSLLPFFPFSLS